MKTLKSYMFLLILVALFAVTISFLRPGARAQQADCSALRPEVTDALEGNASVDVFISLRDPAGLAPSDVTIADMRQNTAQRQDSVLSSLELNDIDVSHQYTVVPAILGHVGSVGAAKLACHPDVVSIELNREARLLLDVSVPLIRADDPAFAAAGINGEGVTIAVVDSGVIHDHPDLDGHIVGEWCYLGFGIACGPDPLHPAGDQNGHGSFVSGIITSPGGNGYAARGVAPQARIFALRVTAAASPFVLAGVVAAAIDDIADDPQQLGIDLINMSLGDAISYAGSCDDGPYPAMASTLATLRSDKNILAFAASGNEAFLDGTSWPACYSSVVSVGAVHASDTGKLNDALTGCSNPTTAPDVVLCFSNASDDLELLAPGARITSDYLLSSPECPPCDGILEEASGTSAASPHAAAVAALLKQVLPGITADDIARILAETGVPVLDDRDSGNPRVIPRVDAYAAVLEDSDSDGCADGAELQEAPGSEAKGGLRDRDYEWDYHNPKHVLIGGELVGDNVIDLPNDILGTILRFQHNDPDPEYEQSWDLGRGRVGDPGEHWRRTPPDGVIDLPNDILGVILQFSWTC